MHFALRLLVTRHNNGNRTNTNSGIGINEDQIRRYVRYQEEEERKEELH